MQPTLPAGSPVRKSLFSPFRLIVLGAALGFAGSFISAAVGLVFAISIGSGPPTSVNFVVLEAGYGVVGVVGPVGFFVLLLGLARALRSSPSPPPSLSIGGTATPAAASARPSSRWNPFRLTVTGAVLALGTAFFRSRYFLTPSLFGSDLAVYEETTGTIAFLLATIYALGSFIAFYGVALSLRDGLAR